MPSKFLCCVKKQVEDVRELDYSHCSLTDVPNEVFTYERTLERLHCHSNRICELPRQLFICQELKVLNLCDNELREIPPAVSSLRNLQLLDCSKNGISSLPDTIKCLKQLCVLDLSVNPIEKLPEVVTNLIFLQELFLNDVYLEYLPGNFGRLSNLKILELRDNCLMILPKSLARSSELLRLDIGQNEFNEFPEVIGKFCKLQELWIDCNMISSIPTSIENLVNLIHLEASNNNISLIPEEIASCKSLVDISLSHNQLGELPNSIGCLFNLVSLKLDNNNLFSLPDGIGDLVNLEELMLYSNMLKEIPATIGQLRKLQILNVDENMLTFIPPEVGSCSSLSVLSLRSNKLTAIPCEVGRLSSLKVLNLVKNSLENLPQSLLNCDNLVALWLSENQSKPLVPMQSETCSRTGQQMLTCFLFPQLDNSPLEAKDNDRKSNSSDAPVTPRHISFVDMKAINKNIPEKPGQLRRAPTPYPKELRALAKHARNYQRDSVDETILSMQNAVHIKAAKIAPTLQQNFASNHNVNPIRVTSNEYHESDNNDDPLQNTETPLLSPASVNSYDKPVGLESNQSYQNLDQTLYSESVDSAYGGYVGNTITSTAENPGDVLMPPLKNISVEERVDGIIKRFSHDLYPSVNRNSPSGGIPSVETLSTGTRSSLASTTGPNSFIYPRGKDLYECNSSEKIYGIVNTQRNANNDLNNKSAMGTSNFYSYNHHGYVNHNDTGSYTSYNLNLTADMNTSLNTTQSHINSPSANVMSEGVYYQNRIINNNGNVHVPTMESIYNGSHASGAGGYSLNSNNVDMCYDSASVSSKQSSYNNMPLNHNQNYSLYNNYSSVYNSLPNGSVVNVEQQQRHHHSTRSSQQLPPANPPPYHIAATFSKQAQFFNPSC